MEQYDLLHRTLIAALIVGAALVFVGAIGWLQGEAEGQVVGDIYADVPPNAALLRLDKRALDEAYEEQIRHLFSIWLRGQARSDTEITNGIRIARRAYNTASQQIVKREQATP